MCLLTSWHSRFQGFWVLRVTLAGAGRAERNPSHVRSATGGVPDHWAEHVLVIGCPFSGGMRTPQQLLAAVVVVALVAVQVRQSIRRGKPSVLLSESGRYWTGSTNDGVGYYADLVNNPSERPEEYLEKQRQDAAEAEEGAAARSRRTSLQQIFHLPDLEQETDGLDLMQDFAPGVTEMADGEVSEPAAPKAKGNDDESVCCFCCALRPAPYRAYA